jgi:general secretion pathway protein D
MEVNEDLLRDIGMQMGGTVKIDGSSIGIGEKFFNASPNAFTPLSGDVTGKSALSTFGQITASGSDWNLLISALQEDENTKTLSAPRILTLNNQEATIIVGRKYPIIESDVSGGGNSDSVTVSLDYYENIGIQLNVVPQICADGYINMLVHPSVSSIESFVSAGVGTTTGANNVPLAEYPVIKVRDAETQTLVADGETIVIGGLLEERTTDGVFKIPLLGDIPFLGHLFRRDTKDTATVDLLIFLKATVVTEANYDLIIEPLAEEEIVVIAVPVEEEIVVIAAPVEEEIVVISAPVEETIEMEEEVVPMDDSATTNLPADLSAEALAEVEVSSETESPAKNKSTASVEDTEFQ